MLRLGMSIRLSEIRTRWFASLCLAGVILVSGQMGNAQFSPRGVPPKPVVVHMDLSLWPTSEGPPLATVRRTASLFQEVKVHSGESGVLYIRPLSLEAGRWLKLEVRESSSAGDRSQTIRLRLHGSAPRKGGEMEATLETLGDRLHVSAWIQP